MTETPIEELDAEATLAGVECWLAEQRDRETRQFRAAAHFADLHATPRHGPGGPALDGMALAGTEQLVRMGGAGTPKVREFAAAELGAALGRSIYAGQQLIADGWMYGTGCPGCGPGCWPAPCRCGWPARWRRAPGS
jgi:hypothetical protein